MKALFLDIDGVVNSAESLKTQYDRLGYATLLGIDPLMAFRVGKIILDTGCKLIISSSWRNHPDSIKDIKNKIYPEIYGITPNIGDFRGDEINAYLKEHPEIKKYAVLDDNSDFYPDQKLFKTEWSTGITEDIAEAVKDYLGKIHT